MGLFGKLFDKKECSVCGGGIGLLGNRKLEDGNLCKECAAKLSPWFSDRRQSTVAEIQEQLAYREANQARVSSFRTTRTLGERTKVLLDEDAGLFMVTSARNLGGGQSGCAVLLRCDRLQAGHRRATGRRSNTGIRMESGRASIPNGMPIPTISTS